ncbi:MAG: integrin alpha [Candidatus Thiodiazotropha taylori]|nr:integrin alpha [Candidatus Thiodiazotropha taylori]MCW4324875.1 integrin alpha [Candidatus Thiodiazotropha taylori]
MKPNQLPALFGLSILLSLLISGCEETYTKEVDEDQKISDSRGQFSGDLDDGDRFGAALANIGDLEGDGVIDLAVGSPYDDDNGENRGAVWVLFLDQDGQVDTQQKISDSKGSFDGDLDGGDLFGSALAPLGDLNGDGFRDIVVSAPMDDDGGTDHGALWILFLKDDGTVDSYQKISEESGELNENLDADDQFGHAVANIGDLNRDGITDLAVGMPNDDDGGADRGAVWILFMNSDGTVSARQKISSEKGDLERKPNDGDRFGSSVTAVGDLDNDGVVDIAVGTSGDDDGGTDRGAVWVLFLNSDGTVDGLKRISHNRGGLEDQLSDGDRFGSALANLGDLNNDGNDDLMVGAPGSDDGGSNRGATWVLFMQGDGEIISASKISDTEGDFDGSLNDNDQFGSSLAGIGDLNQDDHQDLAVGAPFDDNGGTDKGATWILFLGPTESHYDTSEGIIFGSLSSAIQQQ